MKNFFQFKNMLDRFSFQIPKKKIQIKEIILTLPCNDALIKHFSWRVLKKK